MPKHPRFTHPLRTIRSAIGLSQPEFGELIGRSGATVQALENGRLAMSPELAATISVETGADTKELSKGRKGRALAQNGQPYSREYYMHWKERRENYDSAAALGEFEEVLKDAARVQKLDDVLTSYQDWLFRVRAYLEDPESNSIADSETHSI